MSGPLRTESTSHITDPFKPGTTLCGQNASDVEIVELARDCTCPKCWDDFGLTEIIGPFAAGETPMTDDAGMEHRYRVPYTVLWPNVYSDHYETSAESKEEAKAKVAALLNRRCTLESDWRWNGEPELIL